MKVFLLNILYPPDGIGGSERSVQYLARGLSQLGHEVQVITQAISETTQCSVDGDIKVTRVGSPAGYQPNVLARSKEEMEALKKSFPGKPVPFSTSVADLIVTEKPSLIHCNVVARLPDIWKYCATNKVPLVQTLRSYSIMCSSRMIVGGRPCVSWCEGCKSEYMQRMKDSSKVSAVVGISEHILHTFLQQGFFADTPFAEVIPNSYEAESVCPLPTVSSADGKIVLGCLGRIHESKGIETVLKAFTDFKDEKMLLKIAGSGNADYIAYLKSKYRSERVEFVGYVNPQEFINSLDVLCVPSLWHEPFGRVNMEALSHGRAVIGSRRGGIPEIVEDGVTGWLYEPYSDLQFKNILKNITKLTVEEWESLHQRCLLSSQRYNVKAVAEQYEALYYNIAWDA